MYRITIEEARTAVGQDGGLPTEFRKLFEQTVPELNLPKIIVAINAKPRVYTKRAKKGGE